MVGRAVELKVHKDEPKLGDRSLVVEGLSRHRRRRTRSSSTTSASTCARGEIVAIAGVQGNGQTELTEAIIGLEHRARLDHARTASELVGASVRRILDEGVGFVPEDRTGDGLVGEIHDRREPRARPHERAALRARGNLRLGYIAEFAEQKFTEFDVRAPGHRDAGRNALRRQPAEGRAGPRAQPRAARLSWRRSPRAAWTSARSSSSTSASSRRGTPASRSSSSRPSWTRWPRWPTASSVMYRGRIVGIVPGDTPRGVLGLMMAGEIARPARRSPRERRQTRAGGDEHHRPGRRADATSSRRRRRSRRAARHLPARSRSGNAIISVLAVVLALIVGAHHDRLHRRGRAGGRRLLLRPARRHDRRGLGRRSPGRTSRCSRARSTTSARRTSRAASVRSPRR